jgi:hypothetical protein
VKAPDSSEVHGSFQNCGSVVWNLLDATVLAPRIVRWFVDFWKICGHVTRSREDSSFSCFQSILESLTSGKFAIFSFQNLHIEESMNSKFRGLLVD